MPLRIIVRGPHAAETPPPLPPGMPYARWVLALTALGLILRCVHYLRCPTIWYDEAALVVNVLQKGFWQLLGPLSYDAPPPPLFLWTQRAVYLLLGDSLYALRLVPFAASCLAMLWMPWLARRVLRPAAVPWAVGLWAVSDRLLWHTCEAKQYGLEACVALGLIYLFDKLRSRPLRVRLAVFTLLAPVVIWLCYPGCFLYGGFLVALLPEVGRSRRASDWLSYGLMTLVVMGSFLALIEGPVRAQRSANLVQEWHRLEKFPPWDQPGNVPWWILRSTLEIVDYACRPTGFVLAPLVVGGAVCLARRRRRDLLLLMLIPMLLPFLASLVEAYPYGGVRVLGYLCPALILLLAEGSAALLPWLWERPGIWISGGRVAAVALLVGLLLPGGRSLWRAVAPWDRADPASAAALVLAQSRPGDLVASEDCSFRYLLRHSGLKVVFPCDVPPTASGRLWVLCTGKDRNEWSRHAPHFPADGWSQRAEYQFHYEHVELLEAIRDVGMRNFTATR